jgi:microcystin-dependent protein
VEATIGQISLFAGHYAPRNWFPCDGRLLEIHRYAPLFSLIGTTYGGDGRTSFALPKIEPKGGVSSFIAYEGTFPNRG